MRKQERTKRVRGVRPSKQRRTGRRTPAAERVRGSYAAVRRTLPAEWVSGALGSEDGLAELLHLVE